MWLNTKIDVKSFKGDNKQKTNNLPIFMCMYSFYY